MTLPIIEEPIYGQVIVETAAWSYPLSWTNQTATITGTVSYSEGGRLSAPGVSQVDVGTLSVTLKNTATVPSVGHLIRVRALSTTELVFTGYVQDVSQRIVFDDSISYTTPITLTTLHCLDWVGYISQFQVLGAGGVVPATGVLDTDSYYTWDRRVAALNLAIDPTYSTAMIEAQPGAITSMPLGDTDMVGSIANHLDLMSSTSETFWYGNHTIPSSKTTGRTSLVLVDKLSSPDSSGITFTDVLGSAGHLHYTEIDLENATANVANTIVVRNRTRFNVSAPDISKIGGFAEQNFGIINGVQTTGIMLDGVVQKSDSTSITTYGNRQAEVDINVSIPPVYIRDFNACSNPSVEYSDDGYSGSSFMVTRRRKPADYSLTPRHGEWAMFTKVKTANATPPITYSGGESDGIPVVAAQVYYLKIAVARSTPSRADTRARTRIQWYDDNEALISTSYGAYVSLTNAFQWYQIVSGSGGATAAPAGAVRATIAAEFSRSGGTANFTVGDIMWADEFMFSGANLSYFDGDTAWDSTYGYFWTGDIGASPSFRFQNGLDDVANVLLAQYSTTSMRVSRIRWNAQEDITKVYQLTVGKTISVTYKGTTNTYRILGIDGNISPDRYMIDYYLAKV